MSAFGLLGIFAVFAILVPAGMLMLPYLLTTAGVKPHRPDKIKNDTYECGMKTIGGSWVRFNFRYYYFALSFLVFSIETVFIFPWAVRLRGLGWFGFTAMLVFIVIITLGLVYEWRKKALEWK